MTPQDWIGRRIADGTGRPYATLDELFVGRTTGEPEYGIVSVGAKRVAVPLGDARLEGDVVLLPLDPARVREAPEVQRTVDSIPPEAGERIEAFFAGARQQEATAPLDPVTAPTTITPPRPADEVEVTVSEEELVVDKVSRATERVRLRKVLVTEHVQRTVPVRKEVIQLETDAPPEGDVEEVELQPGDEPTGPAGR